MKRQLKAGAGASLLLAAAASVALVGGAESAHSAGTPSSAYGISATGLIAIEPTPVTVSEDGSLQEDQILGLPVEGLLDAGVVETLAENDHAKVALTDINVTGGILADAGLGDVLAPIVDACNTLLGAGGDLGGLGDTVGDTLGGLLGPVTEGLSGTDILADANLLGDLTNICDTLDNLGDLVNVGSVIVECNGTTGEVTIADLNALGLPVEIPSTAPNTSIPLDPLLNITINKQTQNADGTFSVEGLNINLLDGTQVISIGTAICGHVDNTTPTAPSPDPVPTHHPVTG